MSSIHKSFVKNIKTRLLVKQYDHTEIEFLVRDIESRNAF